LRDEQGDIIGYLLIGTDNTARKQAEEALLKAGALQNAIFNSANFSSIATDAKGVIQIFNVGAERMLGYAADGVNKITPADISDPQEVIARAKALSAELATPITPGFEALVFKASRGIEDIYELTYIRKDGSRFPAVVSVTALRDAQNAIIGYLLIGTDNTARKRAEEALLKAGALQSAIFNSANFLQHRHRRQGRHSDLQCRRRTHAGLCRRRRDEQDHSGRYFRPAGSDRAGQGVERRAGHADHPGLRGPGVQGLARHRGHLRTDLHPQGRQPFSRRWCRSRPCATRKTPSSATC
jgi:PAS domain S-box-containing protein